MNSCGGDGAEPLPRPAITELHLSMHTLNALRRSGIDTVADLADKTAADLRDIRYVGIGTVVEIATALAEHGLTLRRTPAAQIGTATEDQLSTAIADCAALLALTVRIGTAPEIADRRYADTAALLGAERRRAPQQMLEALARPRPLTMDAWVRAAVAHREQLRELVRKIRTRSLPTSLHAAIDATLDEISR